jgi:ubiquinone/menaquinone biosynthesis C-methylase UbiE
MGFYENRILPHLINLAMRNANLVPYRKRAASAAGGRVLEIGVGSGLNLPFYTDRATEVVGIEPHPRLRAMAARKDSIIPARMVAGTAESIPLDRHSIDTVLTTWTLCSIPDVGKAFGEIRRVLKPGGQLLFAEHGLAVEERVRRRQQRFTPLWKRFTGGCHLDLPISKLIEDAGFRIVRVETGYAPGPKAINFIYEGCAQPD